MGKAVIVISKTRDIIKDDINTLLDMFERGYTYTKKKIDSKSFAKVAMLPDAMGLLWFVSEDYTGFVAHIDRFKSYVGDVVTPVFEYKLNSLDTEVLGRFIKHSKLIISKFKLKPLQFYVKLNLEFINTSADFSELTTLFKLIHDNHLDVSRIQADFSKVTLSVPRQVKVASVLTALASKYKIMVSSCRSAVFSQKNMWISCEPCISGNIMGKILNCKMVTVRSIAPPHELCLCHKYIDILGAGEVFDGDENKVRLRDRDMNLKKINVKRKPKNLMQYSDTAKLDCSEL